MIYIGYSFQLLTIDKVKPQPYPASRELLRSLAGGNTMPENETLTSDPRRASRWRPLCQRLESGQTPHEVFPDIEREFYARLRRVWRQWQGCSVDPNELFAAALDDPSRLAILIQQTHNDPFARLLRDVAAGLGEPTLEGLLRAFLDAEWENVRDSLRLDCREDARGPEFVGPVEAMLRRVLRGLLANPSRVPARPPRSGPPRDLTARLADSLLS